MSEIHYTHKHVSDGIEVAARAYVEGLTYTARLVIGYEQTRSPYLLTNEQLTSAEKTVTEIIERRVMDGEPDGSA